MVLTRLLQAAGSALNDERRGDFQPRFSYFEVRGEGKPVTSEKAVVRNKQRYIERGHTEQASSHPAEAVGSMPDGSDAQGNRLKIIDFGFG